ncbi:uncharacterized protein LOC122506536 [Leptopilina heterotoma]|uniref:uncharacterized protein LOC122506536 n=1 Tax=Leptopilina heterotoma TaxID=63436 RepID=UPI001CA9E73F|nr:uncharacterized protein LOC122506536 [Leptopilina heterotoma]
MHLSTNESREDVACSIRSLLMTYQHGVTVAMLVRDYEEIECTRIPFDKFNCPSLLVFLRQLNNYVRIERKDGQTLLYPVECEKSKHIAELVKHQRSKNPNRRRFQKPYLNFCANRPQVSINQHLLTQLVTCINLCPHGLPVNHAIQYINQYIHPLQITRPELEHQLKALSHLIAIYGDNIYPIHQFQTFAQQYINFSYAYNQNSHWTMNRNNNIPQIPTAKPNAERIPSLFEPLKLVDQSSNKIPLIVKGTNNVYKPNDKLKTQSTEVTQNEQTKSNPRKNVPANLQTSEISKVCEEKKVIKTDIRENESTSQAAKKIEKEEDIIESDRNITRLTQIKLLKLIHKYPNGIWCSELQLLYLREYNTPLTFEKSEYSSLLDFVSNLPNIFHCVKPLNEKRYKLFNAKHSIPHLKGGTSYLNDLPLELDLDDFKTSLLKEVMGIEDTVKHTSVTKFQESSNQKKQYEEILVSNVISPSFFWIHLCKNSTDFKKFVSELKNFYESNNSKYKVPLTLLQRGLNVVCFFKDRWNRGLIKEVSGDSQITISLYDYGIEKKFFPDEIHFLHKSFSNFPVQAIPCSLHNVKPYKSSMWKQDVIWQFVSKTSFPLIATVENIDLEENQLSVVLTDTRTDEDFHINDWLCSEKFGEPGKYSLKNNNFPFSHYKDCLKQKGYCSLSLHYTKNEEDETARADIVPAETIPNESGNTRLEKYPQRLENLLASLVKSNISEDTLPPLKKIPSVSDDNSIVETSEKSKKHSHRLENLLATRVKSTISEDTLPPLKKIPSVSEDNSITETTKTPICSRLLLLQRLNKISSSNCNVIEQNGKNHEDKPSSSKDDSRSVSNYSNSVSSLDGSFKGKSSTVSSKESTKQPELEIPYFGTFASECGGRGKMEKINWQEVLQPKITVEKQQQKSENNSSENNIQKNIVEQQEELKVIPPLIQRLLKLQSKQKRT